MKRTGIRNAVAWIASNDVPGGSDPLDLECVSTMKTIGLIADLYGCSALDVATRVIAFRLRDAERTAFTQVKSPTRDS